MTAILCSDFCASAAFGKMAVSTPFLKIASTLSASILIISGAATRKKISDLNLSFLGGAGYSGALPTAFSNGHLAAHFSRIEWRPMQFNGLFDLYAFEILDNSRDTLFDRLFRAVPLK